jgi:hypothetical protein
VMSLLMCDESASEGYWLLYNAGAVTGCVWSVRVGRTWRTVGSPYPPGRACGLTIGCGVVIFKDTQCSEGLYYLSDHRSGMSKTPKIIA